MHHILSQIKQSLKDVKFLQRSEIVAHVGLDASEHITQDTRVSCSCASKHTFRKVCPCNKLMFVALKGAKEAGGRRGEKRSGRRVRVGAWSEVGVGVGMENSYSVVG